MKSSRIVLINVIVILVLLIGGGAAVYYYQQAANYISTDNARVDGQAVTIASPAAGKLTDWRGEVGKAFRKGDTVGTVQAPTGSVSLTIPANGTIVQQSAVPDSVVAPGSPLARAFDLTNLYVTANIKETNIHDVQPNQNVDVYVDAFPGTTLSGKISQIGLATAGTFSLLPTTNTSSNYTKVTQVIPVTVTFDGYQGLPLVPGMNASIRIHK